MALLRDLKPGQKGYVPPKIVRGPWGGMAPNIDPQMLADGRPYLLTNMRLEGGIWVMRGGQQQLCNLEGKVLGLHDHQIGAQRGLFLILQTVPESIGISGPSLGIYDQEQTPNYKLIGSFENVNYTIQAGLFGTDILFNDTESIPPLIQRFVNADTSVQDVVAQLPSGYSTVSAFMEHEGVMLIAAVGTAASGVGTSAIFSYDGVTLTDELSGINVVKGFGKYRNTCVAIFDGTPNSIRVRSSAGVWGAPIAPGAGTVKVGYADRCASYRDKLYIPPDTAPGDLFSFNGTTLTRIQPATTGVDVGSRITACAVFNGYLYYLWGLSPDVYIGRFDGTTWTANHKHLTTQFDPNPTEPVDLKQYRAALWAACGNIDFTGTLYSSTRDDTGGPWIEVSTPTPTDRPTRDMIVY